MGEEISCRISTKTCKGGVAVANRSFRAVCVTICLCTAFVVGVCPNEECAHLMLAGHLPKGEESKHTTVVKLCEHNFTLPKGFTIEKVAGSPLVERPVNGSFDEQGHLYVSDSSGSNDKPTEQLKNPTHRVMRLESSKKNGVFDKSVVFADKLSFLQGTLWYKGSLYVAAPPVILKLTDTDGDGVADKREVWFSSWNCARIPATTGAARTT